MIFETAEEIFRVREEAEATRKQNIQDMKKIILTEKGQKAIADALLKIENKVGSKLFCRKMFEEDIAEAYLEAKKEQEIKEQFYFFWKGSFSQWTHDPMVICGITYNCCEQWMMAQKARLFKDEDSRDRIMSENNWDVKPSNEAYAPAAQKALGRLVKNFNPEVWNKHARNIVFIGNYARFSRNSSLKKKLLATGNKEITEASPFDKTWGNGLRKSNPLSLDKKQWPGTNWLGQEIQNVREQIKKEDAGEKEKINIDEYVRNMF